MRVIYLGTPLFAVEPLRAIIENGFDVVAIVTQVDKPNVRGNKIVFTPVKAFAIEHNIPVYQFSKIRTQGVEILKSLNADVMVTAGYGQILSQEIIDICKYGILNIHGSVLPKYRGASPIPQAIIDGAKETGITIVQTGVGLDDGDILKIEKMPIEEDDTCETMINKLSVLGGKMIVDVLSNIDYYRANKVPQDEYKASKCGKFTKEMAFIDFNDTNINIVNKIKGMNCSPVAKFVFNEEIYKVYNATCTEDNLEKNDIGEVVYCDKHNGFCVKCGSGVVKFLEIQAPNGKRLKALDFINGKKIVVGNILK